MPKRAGELRLPEDAGCSQDGLDRVDHGSRRTAPTAASAPRSAVPGPPAFGLHITGLPPRGVRSREGSTAEAGRATSSDPPPDQEAARGRPGTRPGPAASGPEALPAAPPEAQEAGRLSGAVPTYNASAARSAETHRTLRPATDRKSVV